MPPKALLASIGGTPEPVIQSILRHKPLCACFLASKGSSPEIQKALAGISGQWEFPEPPATIVTADPESLVESYRAACAALRHLAEKGYDAPSIVVDYTGGTKSMSAALALAAVSSGCLFSYVGGAKRTKAGLGIVLSGSEQVATFESPWALFAVEEMAAMARFFNHHHYEAAAEIAERLRRRELPEAEKLYAKRIALIARGYEFWDRFEYRQAANLLEEGALNGGEVEMLRASLGIDLASFSQSLQNHRELLRQYHTATGDHKHAAWCLVGDLLGNAARRAAQGRYDDATVRLYRALEMVGQIAFCRCFGCEPAHVDHALLRQKIPAAKHSEINDRMREFALNEVFRHLALAGDPFGNLFQSKKEEVIKLQRSRNLSMLIHGHEVMKKKSYEHLLEVLTPFLPKEGIEAPEFPRIPERAMQKP